MKKIWIICRKEFRQIFRNKGMLPVIFVMPIVQLCVLVFAATYEMKDIRLFVSDQDRTPSSQQIIDRFNANSFFHILDVDPDIEKGKSYLQKQKADLILCIPNGYGDSQKSQQPANVQILVDAVNGSAASLRVIYTQSVLNELNSSITQSVKRLNFHPSLSIPKVRHWYNPQESYIPYMLPGILCIMITALAIFLSSMTLVREKEIGTIEQINVSPLSKQEFIAGKLLPTGIICFVEFFIGIFVARFAFGVPFLGSFWVLIPLTIIYLILVQSFGLFISTITNTQQQAMFVAWFFLVIFILLSGLFTPVESMPILAQDLNHLNPMFWLVKSVRMVLLKGSDWRDLSMAFSWLGVYAVLMFALSVFRYRKGA